MPQTPAAPSKPGVSGALLAVLALLSAVAPFATDMYLPAFTDMADDLDAGAAGVQLTLTAFLVGLATGQFISGPLSDRFGRRAPLLLATSVATLAAALCALAPNVGTLVAMRFVQGFTGAAGIVIARAVVADRTTGQAAAKVFSLLASIGGIAPVVAPLAGGALVPAGWRSVFWALTGISALMLLGALFVVPESLPRARRHSGGLAATGRAMRRLLTDRGYLGHILTFAFAFAGLMGYISASPFVVQNVLGLSTTAYTLDFAANALGMVVTGLVNARLIGRFTPQALLRFGQGAVLLGSAALAAMLAAGLPAAAVLPVLFLVVSSFGLVMGNSSALAMGRAPYALGTGAAMMGALQFSLGALVSPLVGLGGEETGIPMGITMLTAALLGVAAHLLSRHAPPLPPQTATPQTETTAPQTETTPQS
ncbi:MFS transporter, DHA1 family, bicyclomycin/chloramphenicol resistance protein [Thermomonospora echinospora]|uniref:MFS transporter, DHA1 family, bicyclomycin/chloramphenicol resistance protein n=1 Tax=Thermomonospora echinospora TaxID=1992 RepID=A0A1H6B2N7_9ACTN|nr:multidrug effflux MFS transporter [Thermomonospora echinospora]SEG55118.1 MFS transporter, DHA1 family, bicyclomycin/chloramphenicol resistance protein [Thermomonospora echinospora]